MPSKGRDGLEPEVIISLLQHTNIPTLLVEGSGDVAIYRWLENILGVGRIDILQCGGRRDLFHIYENRHLFMGKPIVFFADLDVFLYYGVEIKYRDIIFTNGYSIENDIFERGKIEFLFTQEEKELYQMILKRMLEIYSDKIVRWKENPAEELEVHAQSLYDFKKSEIRTLSMYDAYEANSLWFEHIKSNPELLVRGKNIMSIYTSILSNSKRSSKYSKENIIELHLKYKGIPKRMLRSIVKIRRSFRKHGVIF